MAAIHVRNVPEPLLAALRERAARNGRSMQQELLQILERAAAQRPAPAAVEPVRLETVRAGGTSTWTREELYGDAGR